MVTWPQIAGNPISKDLNFKTFPGEESPDPQIAPQIAGNPISNNRTNTG